MGKNFALISAAKMAQRKIDQLTPEIYASLAIALHRSLNFTYEQIQDIFNASQDIWEECVNNRTNMIEMCLEETGIDLKGKK